MKDELNDLHAQLSIGPNPVTKLGQMTYLGIGKRSFDVVFASAALIFLSPVIAALWLAVKRDGGPGFFGHKRVGRNGRIFTCWKLRTMVPDAEKVLEAHLAADPAAAKEWQDTMKLDNDLRITRLGQFLRKSSLDELPQFWNVLVGDMSVVGPRPVTMVEIMRYGQFAEAVLSVSPGITGLWQISGRNDISYDERIALDHGYVKKVTFLRDIKIIGGTIKTVLRMSGK